MLLKLKRKAQSVLTKTIKWRSYKLNTLLCLTVGSGGWEEDSTPFLEKDYQVFHFIRHHFYKSVAFKRLHF